MRERFCVTYEVVTPESAEHGDAESRGYVAPGQWRDSEPYMMTLREAVDLVDCAYDRGRWFSEHEGRTDYRTGAVETRGLHPPANITPSSYARLRRVLKVGA